MKHFLFFCIIIANFNLLRASNIVPEHCIVRDDNSFVLYHDIHSQTEKIAKNDLKVIKKFTKEININTKLESEIYIYKITLSQISSYMYAMITEYNQIRKIYLFSYNSENLILNDTPMEFDNYYAYNFENGFLENKLLESCFELVEFDDLNNSVIFKLSQRIHRGNARNGLLIKYYRINMRGLITFRFQYEKISQIFDKNLIRFIYGNTIHVYFEHKGEIVKIGSYKINKDTNAVESVIITLDSMKEFLIGID